MGTIYGLKCPQAGNFRYIGKTVGPLNRRLKRHIREARCDKSKYTHKENWIRLLGARAEEIEIICIEESDYDSLASREIFWIAHYRQILDLTNTSDGGEGNRLFGSANPMFGRTHSDLTIARMRESKIGEKNPRFGKPTINTPETRLKISNSLNTSAAFRKFKADPSLRTRIRKTLSRPVYLITLDGTIHKEYNSCRDIAAEFNLTYSAVKNARRFGAVFQRKYRIVYAKDLVEHETSEISED